METVEQKKQLHNDVTAPNCIDGTLPWLDPKWVEPEAAPVFRGYNQLSLLDVEQLARVIDGVRNHPERNSFVVGLGRGELSEMYCYDDWVKRSLETAISADEWKKVKIVGFGEGSHGTENFFETQAAGTRYMIQYRNARCVLLEVPVPFVMLMNEALQTRRHDLIHPILATHSFTTWSNPALYRLFCFICDWNKTHETDRVHVVGIDPDATFMVSQYQILSRKMVDEDARGALRAFVETVRLCWAPEQTDFEPHRERMQAALEKLTHCTRLTTCAFTQEVARLAAHQVKRTMSGKACEQASKGQQQRSTQWDSRKLRDELMAENVRSHVERIERDSAHSREAPRFVVLAHNFHIAATHCELDPNEADQPPFELLGTRLTGMFGDEAYLPFVATGYDGTVTARGYGSSQQRLLFPLDTTLRGSFEDILHGIHNASFFLNVKDLKDDPAGDFLNQNLSMRYQGGDTPWLRAFTPGFVLGTACKGVFFHERVQGSALCEYGPVENYPELLDWLQRAAAGTSVLP